MKGRVQRGESRSARTHAADPRVRGVGYSRVDGFRCAPMPTLRCVDELTHPSCDLCSATVPRNLTHFHQLWHESQSGQSTPFFGDQVADPEVTRLLQMVAALRAVPPVTARTEFVKDLRARLVAELLRASGRLSAVASRSENE